MPYTDRDKVRHVLAPDGEYVGTAASLSDEQLDEIIDRVDSRVDVFLNRRYNLPILPVPTILMDIATDIAAYDVTLAYYKGTDLSDQDPVIRRYRDARGMLGQLSTGLLVLDLPEVDEGSLDDPVVINPAEHSCPGDLHYVLVREVPRDWRYRGC